jgi:hypothetical protein
MDDAVFFMVSLYFCTVAHVSIDHNYLNHPQLLRIYVVCFNLPFFGYLYFNMVVLQRSGMRNEQLQYIYQDAMS